MEQMHRHIKITRNW